MNEETTLKLWNYLEKKMDSKTAKEVFNYSIRITEKYWKTRIKKEKKNNEEKFKKKALNLFIELRKIAEIAGESVFYSELDNQIKHLTSKGNEK